MVDTSKKVICFAHRGASGHEPENTILSFQKALQLGAKWIELDVRVVESQAVVFHDRNLMRMTGVPGLIAEKTLNDLGQLKLPKGERIPLLRDVLDQFKGRACLQIELKGPGSGAVVAEQLNAALANGWSAESLLVSSFDHYELLTHKTIAPKVPRGVLIYGYTLNYLSIARRLAALSVHLHIDSATKERIVKIQQAGFRVYVYTVDDPKDIKQLIEWGVDGLFTNFPERVLRHNEVP